MTMGKKEFYIGYLPKMPPGIARVIRPFIAFLLVAGVVLAVIFLIGQKPFARSFFEFGTVRDFEGTIQARPIPFLLIEKPEKNNGLPMIERIPLVAEGKTGADDLVRGFDGRRVRLRGTRIYREDMQMIEVAAGSVERQAGDAQNIPEKEENLGTQTLRGEITDSKCYLGVMNPGEAKTHRQCAVNCLRGGIPALFVVRDRRGNVSELWLLSEEGGPVNREILDFVAEPVEITGRVRRAGAHLYLYFDPKNIRRLP